MRNIVSNFLNYVNNEQYFENMKRLDKVRNQSLFNVFPELINLKKYEIV